MNLNPTDDVRKEEETKLPVLQNKKRDPIFNKEFIHIMFILGGPGTGKGTQAAKLAEDWDFVHLSAGDLLREEQQREGSEWGFLIKKYIEEGEIVPMEITVGLLQRAMLKNIRKERRKFVIDGFPRRMDQALAFESNICEAKLVVYLEGPEEVMVKRLIGRGRSDDNIDTIRKRLAINQRDAEPIKEYYDRQKKLVRINCDMPPDRTSAL